MHHNLVLCYHALSPSWQADLCTTPARFERQLRLLLGRGYQATTFSHAVVAPARSSLLAVTFDDAFLSVFTLGRPILQRLGIPASLFVPTDYIDSDAPLHWDGIDRWLGPATVGELSAMSWPQIASLQDEGWEIGSHTGSHPRLPQCDDAALADELGRSKAACEAHLPGPCTSIAYPYGDTDDRVIAATARAGYEAAAGLPGSSSCANRLDWPRVGIYRLDDDRRFRLKVSPIVARLRRTTYWRRLESARSARSRVQAQ